MPGEHQLHVRMDPELIKKAKKAADVLFKGNLSALVANCLQQVVDKLAARTAAPAAPAKAPAATKSVEKKVLHIPWPRSRG